jgi:alkanesulfonate monooxygenase SsuD/methylene tetrahydromethanopterin reductase-like flavin-dependent oxidoreductase (luciferase family)
MLKLAGTVADGTVTWMTGTRTIDSHIAPTIRAAAEAAGRPAPRIGVSLPVCVTSDTEAAAASVDRAFAIYPGLPSYKAMLDKEGAERPSDIALLGDEDAVVAAIERLAAAGATDFVASISGNREERDRTFAVLSELVRSS